MLPLSALLVCALAAPVAYGQLTLVVSSDGHPPAAMMDAAKSELRSILRFADVDVEWRERTARSRTETYQQMIVVQLHGSCEGSGSAVSSALASTHISNDVVLPFVEVHCDRVARLLAASIASEAPYRRNLLVGRALARVLAHEIYHVLGQVQHHQESGLAKARFSARDLIASEFRFHEAAALVASKPTITITASAEIDGTGFGSDR